MAKHILFLGEKKINKLSTRNTKITGETEKAIKITQENIIKGKVRLSSEEWLPKSEIKVYENFISMPQWLGKKVKSDRIIFVGNYKLGEDSPINAMTDLEAVAKLETGETKISN